MNKNIFNSVQVNAPDKNVFDLTHDVKMSGRIGELMPCLVMECLPGDKFNIAADTLVRLQPMIAPVMHRMDVFIHYWFVPNRLIWPGWEDFITNIPTGGLPYFNITTAVDSNQERFLDYMGIPPIANAVTPTPTRIQAIPFGAYQCIYHEWYRDENLVPEFPFQVADGLNTYSDYFTMRQRAYEHDYFTSALPFAQKGTAVDMPMGNIVAIDTLDFTTQIPHFRDTTGATPSGGVNQSAGQIDVGTIGINKTLYDPDGTLVVEPTLINDLRLAFRLQEWLEINARAGNRYAETLLGHFGVRSADSRLQRPEYITGVKSPVIISEVLNTAGDGTVPQGNMAGHGYSVGNGYVGDYFCQEHGYIIGIVSCLPKTGYMQGIPRHYLREENTDFVWPKFAHLGEQAILKKELMAFEPDQDDVFGYVPRYAEMRYMPNRVAGDFRSTLDFWHMVRILDPSVVLNQEFIECNAADVSRVFAVEDPDEDQLLMEILHKIKVIRALPYFGTPMI